MAETNSNITMGNTKNPQKMDMHQAKHQSYSLAEITEKMHHEFDDEINGANMYLDMAISANDMHHEELAHWLSAMARDEFSHASFIHHHLKKSGVDLSESDHKMWKELEDRFHRVFSEEGTY